MNTQILTDKHKNNTSPSRCKYTFKEEFMGNPMSCLVDCFWDGLEVESFSPTLARVKGIEVEGENLISAISDQGGDVPPEIFWTCVDNGAVCVMWDWIEPVQDASHYEVPEFRGAIQREVAA